MSKRTFSDSGLEADEDDYGYGYEEDDRLGIDTPFCYSTPAHEHYGYGGLNAGWDAHGFTFRYRGGERGGNQFIYNSVSANAGDIYENMDAGNTTFSHERDTMGAFRQTFEGPTRACDMTRDDYEDVGNAANYSYPAPATVDDIHRHYYHDHNPLLAENNHQYYYNRAPAPLATTPIRPSSSASPLSSSTLTNDQPIWHTATTHFRSPPLSATPLSLPLPEHNNTPLPHPRRLLAGFDALAIPPPASTQEEQANPAPHTAPHEHFAAPTAAIHHELPRIPLRDAPGAQQAARAEHESVAERLRALVDGSVWRRGWGWGQRGV